MIEKLSNIITSANKFIAKNFIIWLIYPMILVMVIEAISRYFFAAPTFFAYDLAWMFYSAFAILGGAYAFIVNAHISADIFYKKLNNRKQAIVTIFCYLIFFFPEMIGLTYSSWIMAINSIKYNERSIYTNWSPSIIPIKIILFLGIFLLLVQGIVKFSAYIKVLINKKEDKE